MKSNPKKKEQPVIGSSRPVAARYSRSCSSTSLPQRPDPFQWNGGLNSWWNPPFRAQELLNQKKYQLLQKKLRFMYRCFPKNKISLFFFFFGEVAPEKNVPKKTDLTLVPLGMTILFRASAIWGKFPVLFGLLNCDFLIKMS